MNAGPVDHGITSQPVTAADFAAAGQAMFAEEIERGQRVSREAYAAAVVERAQLQAHALNQYEARIRDAMRIYREELAHLETVYASRLGGA